MQTFSPWLPDLPVSLPEVSTNTENVIPFEAAYKPFKSIPPVTPAVAGDPLAARTFLSLGGGIFNFVGTATALYLYDSVGNTWVNVSRVSGYNVPADGTWTFAQFQDRVYATNGFDTVQEFILNSSSIFADRVDIPIGRYLATTRLFVVMASLANNARELAWCALGDPSNWVFSAETLADHQVLSDGGDITGITSGDAVLVIQREAANRMTFAGPPLVFNIERFSTELGSIVPGSLTQHGELSFVYSTAGFKMIRGAQEISHIGDLKIDNWMRQIFGFTNFAKVNSTVDPKNKIYVCNIPTSTPTCDTLVIYHWPTGKWSKIAYPLHLISRMSSEVSYTLDNIDGVFGANLDAMMISLDSPTLSATGIVDFVGFILGGSDNRKAGFFNGPTLAALIETGDVQYVPGKKSMLRNVRPVIESNDTLDLTITPSVRDRLDDIPSAQASGVLNRNGRVPLRANGRYHRLSVLITAGIDWQFAIGIDDPVLSQEAR